MKSVKEEISYIVNCMLYLITDLENKISHGTEIKIWDQSLLAVHKQVM